MKTASASSDILERFRSPSGRSLLLEIIGRSKLVNGDQRLARRLQMNGDLKAFAPEKILIRQNGRDSHVYLILSGRVEVLINGRRVGERIAGDCVGEFAAIGLVTRRSATIVALDEVIVLRIAAETFQQISRKCPALWRNLASDLAQLLRGRTEKTPVKRRRPTLFIGSSSEALEIAEAIERTLGGKPVDLTPWREVFEPSGVSIDSLVRAAHEADFALLIMTPDDKIISRGRAALSPRDNVLFELGLFVGALGRERTFFIMDDGSRLKLPTDLMGVTALRLDKRGRGGIAHAVRRPCDQLMRAIGKTKY